MQINEIITEATFIPKEIIAHQREASGAIKTLFADGTEFTYKNEEAFKKAQERATKLLADKLDSSTMKFIKGLGKYKLWGPLMAFELAELWMDRDVYSKDPRTFFKNCATVGLTLSVTAVISAVRAGKLGGKLISWALGLRSGAQAAAALGSYAAVPSGGLSLIIGLGAWVVVEFFIWWATDAVAEYLVSTFYDKSEVEKELSQQLSKELLYAAGMHHIQITDAKKDPNHKSVASQLTKQDIDKIANLPKDEIEKIAAKDPNYKKQLSKYLGPERKSISSVVGAQESLGEETKKKTISDFISHMNQQYGAKTADQVKQAISKKLKNR